MVKIYTAICLFLSSVLLSGCSGNLDNSYFVDEYVYKDQDPGSGESGGADEVGPDQVKVISFNVRTGGADAGTQNAWGSRNKGIPPMLEKENPTVFGVQEALRYQMNFIKDNVSAYDCIGVGRDDGADSGEIMGIFYKKDILELGDNGTFWLSETPDKPSKGWGANYYRTATWAIFTVKESGKKFFYMNTHLDHQSAEARKNSILLICDKMEELNPAGYPAILTADFNSSTEDPIFDPLKLVMEDARSTSPVTDQSSTFNGWGTGTGIIDHIFYNTFNALEYRTIMERWNGVQYISDHYPISALLEFE